MYRKKMVNRNGTLGDIDTDASTFDILVFKMWSLSIKYIKNSKIHLSRYKDKIVTTQIGPELMIYKSLEDPLVNRFV